MQYRISHNEAASSRRRVLLYAIDFDDGKTEEPGLVIAPAEILVTKPGGSPQTSQGTVTEIGNGLYYYTMTQVECDTLGEVSILLTKDGIRDYPKEVLITDQEPLPGDVEVNEENIAQRTVVVYCVNDVDALTPVLGITAPDSLLVSKNGAAFAAAIGNWAMRGGGIYTYEFASSEIDTVGFVALRVSDSSTGTEIREFIKEVQVGEAQGAPGPANFAPQKYRIPKIPENKMRAMIAKNPLVGPPKYYAIYSRRAGAGESPADEGTTRHVWEVMFYPIPDQDYKLEYRYKLNPPRLKDGTIFPRGMTAHSELLISAVQSACELQKTGQHGARHVEFLENLKSSIRIDRASKRNKWDSAWPVQEFDDDGNLISTGADAAPGKSFRALARDVGEFVGYGAHPDDWSHRQEGLVIAVVQSGVEQMYKPPVLPDLIPYSYKWSWLEPLHTFSTVADQEDYDVPADLAAIEGDITYNDLTLGRIVIEIIGENDLRKRKQLTNQSTGRPRAAAIITEIDTAPGYQRHVRKLRLWPVPSEVLSLTYRYAIQAQTVGESGYDQPIPIGSEYHSETLVASCLAVAEQRILRIRNGPQYQLFMERLRASITYDMRAVSGTHMRDNMDYSDDKEDYRHPFYSPHQSRSIIYTGA